MYKGGVVFEDFSKARSRADADLTFTNQPWIFATDTQRLQQRHLKHLGRFACAFVQCRRRPHPSRSSSKAARMTKMTSLGSYDAPHPPHQHASDKRGNCDTNAMSCATEWLKLPCILWHDVAKKRPNLFIKQIGRASCRERVF